MWFDRPPRPVDWSPALEHLRRDARLRPVIDTVGPCLLAGHHDYFPALCQIVLTQQVSMAVADVLYGRLRELFPSRRLTPSRLMELSDAELRQVGLSRQKLASLRDLAAQFEAGKIPTGRFAGMDDQQITDCLVGVKGIGPWSVQMFLIFVLNRPDVFPANDLGIRKACGRLVGRSDLPSPEEALALAAPWRPWRTIATWYLWQSLRARA